MRALAVLAMMTFAAFAYAGEADAEKVDAVKGREILLTVTVPPRPFYVIGESIPIEWKFTNTTSEPMGMLWERCCLTYGGVSMVDEKGERLERKVPPPPPDAPPGWTPDPKALQAFHAFPPISQIAPHDSVTFTTVLDNWVELAHGGKFKVTARYAGAPASALQQGEKVKMWNGSAEAPSFELELLTPREYVEKRGGLGEIGAQVTPDSQVLKPGEPLKFTLVASSIRQKYSKLSFGVWILDPSGKRVTSERAVVENEIELGTHEAKPVETSVSPEAMLGQSLAPGYSAFVDLIDLDEPSQRFPSKPVTFSFELNRDSVLALIRDAVKHPGVRGERSLSMRSLRAYLKQAEPFLRADGFASALTEDAEKKLCADLRLAAAVAHLADKQQVYRVGVAEAEPGMWKLADAGLATELNWDVPKIKEVTANNLAAIQAIHNHLGGRIAFEILANPKTRVLDIRNLCDQLVRTKVMAQTTLRLVVPDEKAPGVTIRLTDQPRANVMVTEGVVSSEFAVGYAIKLPDPKFPESLTTFSTEEIDSGPGRKGYYRYVDAAKFREAILKVYSADSVRVLLDVHKDSPLNPLLISPLAGFGVVELQR